jgi:hypothetical protein
MGYEIVSTGGSAKAVEAAGVPVKKVEDLTGFPEMLDGGWRHCLQVEPMAAAKGVKGFAAQLLWHTGSVQALRLNAWM